MMGTRLALSAFLLVLVTACSPKLNHQVGVLKVYKTVPEQIQIDLDGSPNAAFADRFLEVSAFQQNGNLGLQLKNVANRPIALLQEQVVTIDKFGRRHELLSAGTQMSPVVAIPKNGGTKEVFPLHRLAIKQAGTSSVRVLLPVMIEGIYHEYHLHLKVQSSPI